MDDTFAHLRSLLDRLNQAQQDSGAGQSAGTERSSVDCSYTARPWGAYCRSPLSPKDTCVADTCSRQQRRSGAQSPAEKEISDNKRSRFSFAVALGYRVD